MRIKNLIKDFNDKHLFVLSIIRIFKNRKNNDYLKMVTQRNSNVFFKRENENLCLDGQTYYIVQYEWKTNGFFAIMRKVLAGCAVADAMNWTPYIWVENSIFNIPGGYLGTNNMFEYYYHQPSTTKYSDILEHENYILSTRAHYQSVYQHFGLSKDLYDYRDYMVTEDLLMYFGEIYEKYFLIREDLQQALAEEMEQIHINQNVVGVHYRGSDYNVGKEGHPKQSKIERYFEFVNESLKRGFEKIFLATDDANAERLFKEKYQDKIIMFTDVTRSDSDCGVHFQKHERENDQYYLGREVLRDMLALSSCGGLIAGLSQVSIFARIVRYSKHEDYRFKRIIDNGLNEKDSVQAKKYYNRITQKQ